MEARDILKRPVITERSSEQMEFKKYTFEVDTRANKTHIKQAVEEIFGVKVEKVTYRTTKVSLSVWVNMLDIQTNAVKRLLH